MFKYYVWNSLYEEYTFVYIYNFNTYIKIHPYVIVEYLQDATNLVTIAINETYQLINGWK
jgi:hypothetical protein